MLKIKKPSAFYELMILRDNSQLDITKIIEII